jgi:hypothetical protein
MAVAAAAVVGMGVGSAAAVVMAVAAAAVVAMEVGFAAAVVMGVAAAAAVVGMGAGCCCWYCCRS